MMRLFSICSLFFIIFLLSALVSCAPLVPPETSPLGREKTTKTQVLETGAELLQPKDPVDAIAIYLNAFHFHNGDLCRQMEAHHYCTKINEDFTQCILYSINGDDATPSLSSGH
jgi:hypothetical protein